MRKLLLLLLALSAAPSARAIGNIVAEDLTVLTKNGFTFKLGRSYTNRDIVQVIYQIPEHYNFGENFDTALEIKPFQGVSFFEPFYGNVNGPKLISAAGTRLGLAVEKQNQAYHGSFSFIKSRPEGKYL